jgi:uncharacterized cofD-like protein
MYLSPEAEVNPRAEEAIKDADFIVMGPGDLYTSVVPNFVVNGISSTLAESKAKKIYILNLMTKLGQTDDFKASDHVYEIERYCGSFLDYVIVNSRVPDKEVLDWYERADNVMYVEDDLDEKYVTEAKVIRADLLSRARYNQNVADRIKRSLIRHDPKKLADVLIGVVESKS